MAHTGLCFPGRAGRERARNPPRVAVARKGSNGAIELRLDQNGELLARRLAIQQLYCQSRPGKDRSEAAFKAAFVSAYTLPRCGS